MRSAMVFVSAVTACLGCAHGSDAGPAGPSQPAAVTDGSQTPVQHVDAPQAERGPEQPLETTAGDDRVASDSTATEGQFATAEAAAAGNPDTGEYDKDIIRQHIRRHLPAILYCFEVQLLEKPELEGTVTVAFIIGLEGTVVSAEASGVDPEVSRCIAQVTLEQMTFPKPPNVIHVRYPYNFSTTPTEEVDPGAARTAAE